MCLCVCARAGVLTSLREWDFWETSTETSNRLRIKPHCAFLELDLAHSLAFPGSSQLTHREAEGGGHLASLAKAAVCLGLIPEQEGSSQRLNEEGGIR